MLRRVLTVSATSIHQPARYVLLHEDPSKPPPAKHLLLHYHTLAPAQSPYSNMAAALSLRSQMAGCTTIRPVSRRTAVRVQAFQVTMKTPEGACKKFELEAGKDLLEGALAAGVEVPNLCRTGTCGACASRLLSGDVHRSDFLLEDEQKDAGFLLLCTSTCKSDVEVMTHQETEMHTVPFGL